MIPVFSPNRGPSITTLSYTKSHCRTYTEGMVSCLTRTRSVKQLAFAGILCGGVLLAGCIMGGDKGRDDRPVARSACVDAVPDTNASGGLIAAGAYHGLYSDIALGVSRESELVLDADGSARNILIRDNLPLTVTKGAWTSTDGLLRIDSLRWAPSSNGFNFHAWRSGDADAFAVRRVTNESFEREERVTLWGGETSTIWVCYQRMHEWTLLPGRYEYTETLREPESPTDSFSFHFYMEIEGDSLYRDGHRVENTPLDEFESRDWRVAGSFLVAGDARNRTWNPSSGDYLPWESVEGLEYIIRLREGDANSFEQWVPTVLSYTDDAYWAKWVRVEQGE